MEDINFIKASEDVQKNLTMRHCKYCKELKPLERYRHYCDECNEIIIKERRKYKSYSKLKERKELLELMDVDIKPPEIIKKVNLCKKCNKPVEYPKWYCRECYEIVEKEHGKKKRDRANERYRSLRDAVKEEEEKRAKQITEEITEKYAHSAEMLCRKELLEKINNYYENLDSIEDLKNIVRILYKSQ